MSEPDFISNSRIAILGLGLMGGSLALALRGRCQALLASDQDPEVLSLANQLDLVDQFSSNPSEILPAADVVILAIPISAILDIISELPRLHPGSAIVLDLGSTKSLIVKAMEGLPSRFDPIGGHPMCGKENIGLENADTLIFQGATFAFTPLKRTSSKAKAFTEQLAKTIGSQPLWVDPDTHDFWSAATSHMPYIVAAALSSATPELSSSLIGPGFRSTTRIAATPASIMLDVLNTNHANILESLKRFREELDHLEGILSSGELKGLEIALMESAEHHNKLITSSHNKEAM